MTLAGVLLIAALAVAVGALGVALGMLLAPRLGRWTERMMDDDDDE